MKGFVSLLDLVGLKEKPPKVTPGKKTAKVAAFRDDSRGCQHCPLDKVKGVNKVKNLEKISGKKIMIWSQNPGFAENAKQMVLIGESGRFFWKEANALGLKREDCDIQFVVRCWPVEVNEFEQTTSHEPKKEEIHCCSIYSEEALSKNAGKAKVHLILGNVAAKTLLKGEYRKDQKTFFSKRLNAWAVVTYHPNFFVRGAPHSKLAEFRVALDVVLKKIGQGRGKYAFVEAQDYRPVSAAKLETGLVEPMIASGERVAVDIEDGWEDGKNVIICIGFCWKPGMSRIVFLKHSALTHSAEEYEKKLAVVKDILENPLIKKVFQHGNYDVDKIRALLGIEVQGYDHDTQYSEYLRFSSCRSFGLAAIADRRFREFAGYKGLLEPYNDPKTKRADFLKVPLKILVRYNGADADLTKRIELDNHSKVDHALLKVMIRCAFPLADMEEHGPFFDDVHDKMLQEWIPARIADLKKKIVKLARNKEFNPNSPNQIAAVVYDRLKLGEHLDEFWIKQHGARSTNKETMQLMMRYHAFPGLVQEYRALAKKESTYMKGYRKSAEINGGRIRTKWWLTGTVTNRLRSGGEKDKSKGIVNLQNIHGDPEIEALVISDKRWRDIYSSWETQQKTN